MEDPVAKIVHRPGPDGRCVCGALETFFEPYFDDPTGYGCEAAEQPYEDTLDRRGFHIRPSTVINCMSDDTWFELTDEQLERVNRYRERKWRNPSPVDIDGI
jgi:hypothetical protein